MYEVYSGLDQATKTKCTTLSMTTSFSRQSSFDDTDFVVGKMLSRNTLTYDCMQPNGIAAAHDYISPNCVGHCKLDWKKKKRGNCVYEVGGAGE